jgi:ATP-dependent RNA helicase DDX18/HAS1
MSSRSGKPSKKRKQPVAAPLESDSESEESAYDIASDGEENMQQEEQAGDEEAEDGGDEEEEEGVQAQEQDEVIESENEEELKEAGKKEKKKKKREERKGKEDKKEKKRKGEGSGILTNKLFSELPISELTANAIKEMNYTHLTQVLKLYFTNYIATICCN